MRGNKAPFDYYDIQAKALFRAVKYVVYAILAVIIIKAGIEVGMDAAIVGGIFAAVVGIAMHFGFPRLEKRYASIGPPSQHKPSHPDEGRPLNDDEQKLFDTIQKEFHENGKG